MGFNLAFKGLIHLLLSSTCFEHYCARLQEDNCIRTASRYRHSLWVIVRYAGDESPLVTCVLNSHLKTVTIPDAVLMQLSS